MTDSWPPGGADPLLDALQRAYLPERTRFDLPGLLCDPRLGRVAVVSSFGTESAVLLHLIVGILPDIEVLFIDTGRHFPETLEYVDCIANLLKLNLQIIRPDAHILIEEDHEETMWRDHPDGCCRLRKVLPLQDALDSYDSWISGQKRYQSTARATVPVIDRDGAKLKLNPLAFWTAEDIKDYFRRHHLPPHPLVERGFVSIGCAPCSRSIQAGEDPRAGRWAHVPEKTECGIHLGPNGRFQRG